MKIFNYTGVTRLLLLILLTSCYLISCKEEFDHTVDVANPVVVSFNPVKDVEEVSVNSSLVITFDEKVKKGNGNIVLKGESTTKTIEVLSEVVTISEDARVVTIKPGELESDEKYTVTIDAGAFVDLLDNKFLGVTSTAAWQFTTAGTGGPMVLSLSPANGSTDASVFKVELSFLAEVKKGSGNISIFQANNAKVADISVASSNVVVNGNKVEVNLQAPLTFGTEYYVTMDAGTILDAAGKKFKGYKSNKEWSFKTTPGSGSELAVHLPLDQDLSDMSGNKFDGANGSTASAKVEFVTDPVRGKVASFVPGSYAVLPKHNLLRPSMTQDFSVNIWFKLSAVGSDPVLFSNSDWDSGNNPGLALYLDGAQTYTGPGSTGRGWVTKITGGVRMNWRANELTPQAPALADNKWHMLTMVVNQTTKRMQIFFDGVEHSSPNDLSTFTGQWWDAVHDYPFTIWEDGAGKYNSNNSGGKVMSGYVDDLRMYNKALTPAEVMALFKN